MSNNIINFFSAKNKKNAKKDKNNTIKLKGREIGNISITVYEEETTEYAIYYVLPDSKELLPIVDLLDTTLSNHGFEVLEELKVKRL